jgi:hypothetical protein
LTKEPVIAEKQKQGNKIIKEVKLSAWSEAL